MPKLSPVVWCKGVFLSPQHLQSQDRYFEDLLRFQVHSLTFSGWGFSSLQIDGVALAEGMLALTQATGLFPDNLAFDMPTADALPPSRPIEECFREGRTRCTFFLAVPERRTGGINVSERRANLSTRFVTEPQTLRDENSDGATERLILFARKNVQILAEGDNMTGSVVIPFVMVERTEGGSYRADPAFVPPVLDVAASPRLGAILRGLLELMVARSSQLAGARRQRNQSLADFTASDVANFWLLYALNSELPELRHMLELGRVHPETAFRSMLRLAGTLMTFSSKLETKDLPRYQHEKLGETFGLLDALLRDLFETIIPRNFLALALKPTGPSIYATDIDKDKYFDNTRFYLAVTANMREPDLIARFPILAKIASATHLENFVRQALPGLRIAHVPVPPRAIPVKLQYQYFMLERSGPVWDAMVRARNFGVYVPDEIADVQMELIILLPNAE